MLSVFPHKDDFPKNFEQTHYNECKRSTSSYERRSKTSLLKLTVTSCINSLVFVKSQTIDVATLREITLDSFSCNTCCKKPLQLARWLHFMGS